MSTPLSTPVRQARLGIASTKSLPLANEYKKLLAEQHQRLWTKHQQDLDLLDDIRSYVKARLAIERDYASAVDKLAKQHVNFITKKFALLPQCDPSEPTSSDLNNNSAAANEAKLTSASATNNSRESTRSKSSSTAREHQAMLIENEAADSRLQKRLAHTGAGGLVDEPDKPCTLYKVWSEHISRLQSSAKHRSEQFEQLIMVVDKLKDIRTHKSSVGKKCLDVHLKRIHEDILVSMVDIEKARKLYNEDESQAKKARENEEKFKKKRSGLLTKFTDLQAKKERSSAQRQATDIQSTQARNDYIMALAAGNAHLEHYYLKDLPDFIHLIDDGVLDHCKVFMATLSECDINSLKMSLTIGQYWSKMINLTGSQRTNTIFLDCNQSACLRSKRELSFEAFNSDPIQSISLEHNADYALQHEIDKWFTWFKKECRNLSQLMHQLEMCQRAFADGKRSLELNGQTVEDLEGRIIELKQQIRKSEAAKLRAQARLKVIKEGGMQIEEWSTVESEIRADMARAQEELAAKRRLKEQMAASASDRQMDSEKRGARGGESPSSSGRGGDAGDGHDNDNLELHEHRNAASLERQLQQHASYGAGQVQLHVSRDSADDDGVESEATIHNRHQSVSRSASNAAGQVQSGTYAAYADPASAWQDDYGDAWGPASGSASGFNQPLSSSFATPAGRLEPSALDAHLNGSHTPTTLAATGALAAAKQAGQQQQQQQPPATSMTVQSSSPLSAIVDGAPASPSQYQGHMNEAYKSDYECDYNRNSHLAGSAASSAEPYNNNNNNIIIINNTANIGQHQQLAGGASSGDPFGEPGCEQGGLQSDSIASDSAQLGAEEPVGAFAMLDKIVVALYDFDKTNEDDLALSQGDVVRVIEISDAHWVKARHMVSRQEGYIPAAYVRLADAREQSEALGPSQESGGNKAADFDQRICGGPAPTAKLKEPPRCKAMYDYTPGNDKCEPDGYPQLALKQGEIMSIVTQGEDDGWWLVEKLNSGKRGHVPSMLVLELLAEEDLLFSDSEGGLAKHDDEDEDDDDAADEDDGEASDYLDEDELEHSMLAMPTGEPPQLQPSQLCAEPDNGAEPATAEAPSFNDRDHIHAQLASQPDQQQQQQQQLDTEKQQRQQPPPLPDNSHAEPQVNEPATAPAGAHERANREAHQPVSGPAHHHHHHSKQPHNRDTPTIYETEAIEELDEQQQQQQQQPLSYEQAAPPLTSSKVGPGNYYEPLSEVDSLDMAPAPPSVVVESFDEPARHKTGSAHSINDPDGDKTSLADFDSDTSAAAGVISAADGSSPMGPQRLPAGGSSSHNGDDDDQDHDQDHDHDHHNERQDQQHQNQHQHSQHQNLDYAAHPDICRQAEEISGQILDEAILRSASPSPTPPRSSSSSASVDSSSPPPTPCTGYVHV